MRRWAGRAALAASVAALLSAPANPIALTTARAPVVEAASPARAAAPVLHAFGDETLIRRPTIPRREAIATRVADVAPPAPVPAPEPGETVIAPPPEVFDAPAPPPAPPPEPLQSSAYDGVEPSGGVWAVIVAINDYPGSGSDLRSAVADGRDVDRALSSYGVPPDHRLVLHDHQATAANISAALDWLVAHAGRDATAVLFYAGHVRKLDRDTEAIVAADGRLVTDRAVADRLAPLRAARTWIAVAACYGAGFSEALGPGRILTAASDSNSLAYENASYGRSYLVEYMVRRAMIERRAPSSIEASFAWAVDALRRDHPNRLPVQYDRIEGELSLAAASQSPQPSPAPGPSPGSDPGDDGGGSGGGSGGGGTGSSDDEDDDDRRKGSCAGVSLGVVKCGRD